MSEPRCHFYSHFAAHKHPPPPHPPPPTGKSPEAPQQLVGALACAGSPVSHLWGKTEGGKLGHGVLEALLKAGSTPRAMWGVGVQSLLTTQSRPQVVGAPEPR